MSDPALACDPLRCENGRCRAAAATLGCGGLRLCAACAATRVPCEGCGRPGAEDAPRDRTLMTPAERAESRADARMEAREDR